MSWYKLLVQALTPGSASSSEMIFPTSDSMECVDGACSVARVACRAVRIHSAFSGGVLNRRVSESISRPRNFLHLLGPTSHLAFSSQPNVDSNHWAKSFTMSRSPGLARNMKSSRYTHTHRHTHTQTHSHTHTHSCEGIQARLAWQGGRGHSLLRALLANAGPFGSCFFL